jgi:glutathione synthase
MVDTFNIGFYLAPGAETKETYTDRLLVEECSCRGHNSYVFNNFTFFDNNVYGLMKDGECLPLVDLDLICLRKEDMDDNDWDDMKKLTKHSGGLPPMINSPEFILKIDKKYMLNFSDFVPDTYFTKDLAEGVDLVYHFGKTILKPVKGRSGKGIELIDTQEKSREEIREIVDSMLTDYNEIVVQDYVPGVVRGDKRVLVVNGEPIGAFLRLPKEGSHKCNIYAGGTSHPAEITDLEKEIIKATAPQVVSDGGLFTGYDFMYKESDGIDQFLIEINGTAVGGIHQANQFLKPGEEPLEKKIIDFVEKITRR